MVKSKYILFLPNYNSPRVVQDLAILLVGFFFLTITTLSMLCFIFKWGIYIKGKKSYKFLLHSTKYTILFSGPNFFNFSFYICSL